MTNIINYRLRITLSDSRTLTGQMLAFDKHMNLVLADCEEFRKIKPKGKKADQEELEQKRTLGLVILRGETIVSISIDGPPPPQAQESKLRGPAMAAGVGIGRVSIIMHWIYTQIVLIKVGIVFLACWTWFARCSSSRCSNDWFGRSCTRCWWSFTTGMIILDIYVMHWILNAVFIYI